MLNLRNTGTGTIVICYKALSKHSLRETGKQQNTGVPEAIEARYFPDASQMRYFVIQRDRL